jgi:hypothetical protein
VLGAFVQLVQELFPSISPYTATRCIETIKQHAGTLTPGHLFAAVPDESLAQGDLVDPMPFTRIGDAGGLKRMDSPGMLLSNTCDAENDRQVLFAPAIPFERFAGDARLGSVKSNCLFSLLFLPGVPGLGDRVIDLSIVQAVSTGFVRRGMAAGAIARRAQLSQLGYYLFLSKLTVHLLRPETEELRRNEGGPTSDVA